METTMSTTVVLKHIEGNRLADFFKKIKAKVNVEPDCFYTIKVDLIKEEATKEKPQQN